MMKEKLALLLLALVHFCAAQDLTLPYFNIAEKKKVTVNATCGEDPTRKDVYCKLVGYDSIMTQSANEILDGQVCDSCLPPPDVNSTEAIPDKAHPALNTVDGDIDTWWQSPPISSGRKYNRVTLSIDLQQTFQVAYIVVTMANSPRPGVWALEKSMDGGQNWSPWQYFAGNDVECQKYFNIRANEKIVRDDQVVCVTDFSKVLPIENGEIYVSLTSGRPSAKDLWSSQTLLDWLEATNIRLRFIQTKTMLGHLMSVAQGDKTVTRRYYYSIKEITVGGRCVCNGHATLCPPAEDSPDLLKCLCQHGTAGTNCDQCAEGYVQKPWRPYTKADPFECEKCNCNGHSDKCHYDAEIDQKGLSMDIHGNMEGGGVCEECQKNTEGINCDTCIFGFFRPADVLPNATDPCQPCDCGDDPRYSGNCEAGGGQCECKEAFRGAEDCSACADGFYDYPDCKPCDCYAKGTELMENGLPFCVAEGTLQCPCLENFNGTFCDECANGYFGFPDCNPCECNYIGSQNDVCNLGDGQCVCKPNYAGRQCDECQKGYYSYSSCYACDCDPQGTVEEICNDATGQCLCKEGFGGPRCDQCTPGWFDYPNCKPCECSNEGSTSGICDAKTGDCPCYSNYGGRKCDTCNSGFFGYPKCDACGCDSLGSKGVSCDDGGVCNCKKDFEGMKCDTCAPDRYNYPLCEECNCDPAGVTDDFFQMGGCANVPEGSLCTCKANVQGRICDQCKPLFWNLQQWNPTGCEDCGCNRPGTIGSLGVCDIVDGQCACKAYVNGDRTCNECQDGFFALSANNGLGCTHCQCDVGGTQIENVGDTAVCDKDSGQCTCRTGIMGRQCNEVQDTYYVPTMHQFQYEIEDGYRADGSQVRFAYDDAKFPGYSWRGYGAFSQLQDEVLQDISLDTASVYRMVLRYTNPNPTPIIAEVRVEGIDDPSISIAHKVLLPPTGENPAFARVSGDKGIYPSIFDLPSGRYTVAVDVPADPTAEEVLVDYFVFLPREYYEPSILKEDVFQPCLAGETLPYCRQYTYPDLAAFPKTDSYNAERPGGGSDTYEWSDKPEVLQELGTSKLASVAKWQPELVYPVVLDQPGKHVLAVAFFTPKGINETGATELAVAAQDSDGSGEEQSGKAYIFDCRYSTLCRQVVTDDEGRVQEFDFGTEQATVTLIGDNVDPDFGIGSVIAIPIDEWSLDLVTPSTECIRKNGECIKSEFPDPPEDSKVIPFSEINSDVKPSGIYVDGLTDIVDITGNVPKPGLYVLVAQYYQQYKPTFDLPMNISYSNTEGESIDDQVQTFLDNDQFYEAVLPLPTCPSTYGCRSVVEAKDPNNPNNEFNLVDAFHIQPQNPQGNTVWLESIIAVPAESFTGDFLDTERVNGLSDYATQCGLNDYYISPEEEGFCRAAIVSLGADFNGGALECECNMEGSLDHSCAKIGGQCKCKENIMGRQCTRCKPGFFGYPDCKECNCPPTATCNEETGDCICAPHVTGTDENPCSQCEENTYGYDPITGCQECDCMIEGTVNGNMSCALESGFCYCKDHVVGRRCDRCEDGYYQYPDCLQCPCDLRGSMPTICNQETAECQCKANVEPGNCDTCKAGSFDLQEANPDGCTDCFCSGKSTFCLSHDRLVRSKIETMEDWGVTSWEFPKIPIEKKLDDDRSLPNYSGELAVSFTSYPRVDLATSTVYFKAPKDFLGNQINSYGGYLNYQITYSGYNMENVPKSPDIFIIGNDISLLYHSGQKPRPNEAMNISAPFDPYYWVTTSGARIDRSKLMVTLTNLEGVYIRASYGLDYDGQSRLSKVALDSAIEVPGDRNMTAQDIADQVTSVEKCECPEGYYGYSCEDCDIGYYRSQEGPLGPFCTKCDCSGHADTCHPETGECVNLVPPPEIEIVIEVGDPQGLHHYCHFHPEKCTIDDKEHCKNNTTGPQCEFCAEGYYGDATKGTEEDCQSCPCPLPENNFAISCDAFLGEWNEGDEELCKCKPHYEGSRCEKCGPGYYGQPEVIGDYCKPCECNGNIEVTDPESCDSVSGICQKCLFDTTGDHCERCENWFFGDAINAKNCRECSCDREGTLECDHMTGDCKCLPGVEGERCDMCEADHWGFDSDPPGCTACDCSVASKDSQCDQETGQCECKTGATGQKCDRCQAGFWNLGPDGCESCGCNIEFTIGGCNPVNGQCECLPGVVGLNCDRCPTNWVLVVNDTSPVEPEWMQNFDYKEGCFPCSSCVADLMESAETLNSTLAPIMDEFEAANSAFFAFTRLEYIDDTVERLRPEIELLNPLEGTRRLQPLENQLFQHQQAVNRLKVDYKVKTMEELDLMATDLSTSANEANDNMNKVGTQITSSVEDMKKIAQKLGTAVSPDLIKTSVEKGNEWLEQMKANDFTEDRASANEMYRASNELVQAVKEFAEPVNSFKGNVTTEEERLKELELKLDDLKFNSEESNAKLRVAKTLNFRNSDPQVKYNIDRINLMTTAATANIELGNDLNNQADEMLSGAQNAFDNLNTLSQNILADKQALDDKVTNDKSGIAQNIQLVQEASDHANSLEAQAEALKGEIDNAKSPVSSALGAANAFSDIVDGLKNATDSAEKAMEAAEAASSISFGVGTKATQAVERTNGLYEEAAKNKAELNEIEPEIEMAVGNIEHVTEENKAVKQMVEATSKALDGMKDLTEKLKQTVQNATDAETVAHDALDSIDLRAEAINAAMNKSNQLSDSSAEMKLAIDATKKALAKLEEARPRRDADPDDVDGRIDRLRASESRINGIRKNINSMMSTLRGRLSQVRDTISAIETGIAFEQGSYLELQPPPKIEELAIKTHIKLFFNVTQSELNPDGKAFILYLGNVEDTFMTDDFMAVEVIENGYVKLTINMGAQVTELTSNAPIDYNEWHELIIDRRGYHVTMTIRSEAGVGDVSEDTVEDKLPRRDIYNRPFGAVFNLHKDYSKLFVGGFPTDAMVQNVIRSTSMDGQIEGLAIGGRSLGLWNYKVAHDLKGAPERNKLREEPVKGLRFDGQSYLAVDRSNYPDVEDEFHFKLTFRPSRPDGVLLFIGDQASTDYAALEIRNGYLTYSFNLGGKTVSLESSETVPMEALTTVEIKREGRYGEMSVNGEGVGSVTSEGDMEQLSVGTEVYIGGYIEDEMPTSEVQDTNFAGCIEEVFFGPDRIDLSASSPGAYGVQPGCDVGSVNLVTFPAANPGYMQLSSLDLDDRIEISFMFRTSQSRALLMYMHDTPGSMYYVSLALMNGLLTLNVSPSHSLGLEKDNGDKNTVTYNDAQWHSVSILIMSDQISLHIDDNANFKVTVQGSEQIPLLNQRYHLFLGGLPSDQNTIPSDATPTKSPFIGCIRDVLVEDKNIIDFNSAIYHTGVEMNTCTVDDVIERIEEEDDDEDDSGKPDTNQVEDNEIDVTGSTTTEGSVWDISPPDTPSTTYGQCKLPIVPSPDPDVTGRSGLRFGNSPGSFLEFTKRIRLRKRSNFGIEFKTSERNGVIFYIADEKNSDFIALFVKNGKLVYGFNCGSGPVYIESNQNVDDDQWHFAEFSRQTNVGKLYVDGTLQSEQMAVGPAKNIEVSEVFHLGGLPEDYLDNPVIRRNLRNVLSGFVGCLKEMLQRGNPIGKWSKNRGVVPCSDKVEPGYFFGPDGGFILASRRYRVGLDFGITMQIKPRNISGLILAIQGRKDYLILQMVDGTMTFQVDNGRGPITAIFKPESPFQFCDGNWHEVHAVKAKNVVTLSVDNIFAQPGIGVPGVSSTDTNHGLFIGGHPRADRLTGLQTSNGYVGCIKNIAIENEPLDVTARMLKGDIQSNVCPTI